MLCKWRIFSSGGVLSGGSARSNQLQGLVQKTTIKTKGALKKYSFNLDFVQNRSDPPPSSPQNFGSFGIFWDTFPKGILLERLVHPKSLHVLAKGVPKLLDLVNPPPLSPTNSKKFGLQKVSQNFWTSLKKSQSHIILCSYIYILTTLTYECPFKVQFVNQKGTP